MIIGRQQVPAMQVFDDVAQAMDLPCDVVLGAFMAKPMGIDLTGRVIYNMEYLHDRNPMFGLGYLDTLRDNLVLDFSQSNVDYLKTYGIEAFYLPYGYHPGLVKATDPIPYDERDIDILFVGSMHHPRRIEIIEELSKHFRVKVLTNHYGPALDAFLGRAKVYLNIHHAEGQTLETVRLNYLIANGCNVVSERGSCSELNAKYSDAVTFCDRNDVVDACFDALEWPVNGVEVIQSMPHDCSRAAAWLKGVLQ